MEYNLISRNGIKTFGDGVIEANKNDVSFADISSHVNFDDEERKVIENAVVEFAKQSTTLMEVIDSSHPEFGRINLNLVITYIALKIGIENVSTDILNLNQA